MRKGLLTSVAAFMGLAAPMGGAIAALSSSASTAVSAVTSEVPAVAPGSFLPGISHNPLVGKHLLSVSLGGLRATTKVQSANWSGYATTADTYQTVAASWTQPTPNCSPTYGGILGLFGSHSAYASFWVGLDGYTSSSVEQLGTDSDCTSGGAGNYYAWYEMYPQNSVDLSTTTYPVQPGDSMSAMVMSNAAGTSFTLGIRDNTRHWTFSIPETGSGFARSSAEVVAEAPSSCALIFCNELPLANFGTVNFTGTTIGDTAGKTGTISAFSNADMQMAQNGTVLATPSGLSPDGSSFSVNWNS